MATKRNPSTGRFAGVGPATDPRRGVHFSDEEEGTWRFTVCSSAPGLEMRTFNRRQTSQDLERVTCLVCLRLMVRNPDL